MEPEIIRFINAYNYLLRHPTFDYKKLIGLTSQHTELLYFLAKLNVSPLRRQPSYDT